ncbi:hypothetical protein [Sinomicrobium sp. M5D2P17]
MHRSGKRETRIAPFIFIELRLTRIQGHNFAAKIVDWAKEYAIAMGKPYVRLDTTGNNVRLIAHYKNSGFVFLGCSLKLSLKKYAK